MRNEAVWHQTIKALFSHLITSYKGVMVTRQLCHSSVSRDWNKVK